MSKQKLNENNPLYKEVNWVTKNVEYSKLSIA